jgi:SAM-dependent methyltransferase
VITDDASDPATTAYGEFYYAHDFGVPYERNEYWLNFFGAVADGIVERLAPRSVLDVGCAMGFLVEVLRDRGVDAWGIDFSDYAISKVHGPIAPYCAVARADRPLPSHFPASYDLVTCVEVIEHIDPEPAAAALGNLCRWGQRVLFSSSSTDYGEPTHVNVKSPEAWAAEFATHGLVRNFDIDVSFLTPWAILFEPGVMTAPAVVARYEREYGEARREGLHLRTRLLDTDRMRAELDARVRELEAQVASPTPPERVQIERQMAQLRDELADARDKTVAARLRAQQLRQQVTDLEGQIEEREHTLWDLLRELEHLRRFSS